MKFRGEDFAPGTITICLRDGRRFVYPETQEPASIIADLRRQGVGDGEIGNTIHVIKSGAIPGVPVLSADDVEEPAS